MIEAPDSAKVCFVQPQLSCPHMLKFTLNLDASRDNFTVLKIRLHRNSLLQEYVVKFQVSAAMYLQTHLLEGKCTSMFGLCLLEENLLCWWAADEKELVLGPH